VNYAQNRNLNDCEKCVADYEIEACNTSKACKEELKVKTIHIIIHLTMYACKLERKSKVKDKNSLPTITENCFM
jgi:hypothetical protein